MKFGVKDLSITALFIAIVCVATLVLKIDIPATGGYFNVGDSMIYIAALLFGPVVGGIAGGIGPSLADVIVGAPEFAPGTLVIKGFEGLIVGYLSDKLGSKAELIAKWKAFAVVVGVGMGAITYYLGSTYYIGIFGNAFSENLFWAVIAVLLGVFIIYVGVRREPRISWQVISVLCGGVEMIVGYYLYETFVLPLIVPGWQIIAIVEVPFNIGQAVIGLIIALPIVRAVSRALPSLKAS